MRTETGIPGQGVVNTPPAPTILIGSVSRANGATAAGNVGNVSFNVSGTVTVSYSGRKHYGNRCIWRGKSGQSNSPTAT
jgi:hypothetical protein